MSEIAISLKNVSKIYRRYNHPLDRLKELIFPDSKITEYFLALQNINLDIYKGETLGIVGVNGSGKSTLLQVISGILTPTTGDIKISGRISALLELGSGFNPEFTGRQNIFFNGRILGLEQKELDAKFDEIAEFADIGQFIDQPVKTYSSGMFVRLAFAVAISVDPDIFIVDEALAVGDEAFQRKCFGRLQNIQDRGGTILFVSHSASLVIRLCTSAILIDKGQLLLRSSPKEVIAKYHKLMSAPLDKIEYLRQEMSNSYLSNVKSENNGYFNPNQSQTLNINKFNTQEFYDPNLVPKSTISYMSRGATIENPYITTMSGKQVNNLLRSRTYIYTYLVKFSKDIYNVRFGMAIKTTDGFELGGSTSHSPQEPIEVIKEGEIIEVKFEFSCLLSPGVYFLNAGVLGLVDDSEEGYIHRLIDVAMFRVQPEQSYSHLSGVVDFCIKSEINNSLSLIEKTK